MSSTSATPAERAAPEPAAAQPEPAQPARAQPAAAGDTGPETGNGAPRSSAATPPGVLELAGGRCVLRFQRRLRHPIERVWAALTEPAELLAWWGRAEVELVEGGQFTMRWLNTDDAGEPVVMHARITRLEPPRLLETTGDIHGVLRFELAPDVTGTGTVLTFSSTAELPEQYRSLVLAGWHYHLDGLAAHLDGRAVELVKLPNDHFDRVHQLYLSQLG